MKKTLLLGALVVAALSVDAQQRGSVGVEAMTLGDRALSSSREVTDTIAPGSWANNPQTQIYRYFAVCWENEDETCGYIVGTNEFADRTKAQQFLLLDNPSTVVEGVIFWFFKKHGPSNSVVRARLYDIDGAGFVSGPVPGEPVATSDGAPGTILASKDFTLADVDTSLETGALTTVMFDDPVFVSEQFAVGFNMEMMGATDSIALLATENGTTDFPDFSWEQWGDGSWYTLQSVWVDMNVDLCLFVLVDNSSVGIDQPGSMNHMRMSFLNGNISNGNVLLGYDVVESGRMDLLVHATNGQLAYEKTFGVQGVGSYQHTISTEGWAPGMYYVTLRNNGQPLTKKLVVE